MTQTERRRRRRELGLCADCAAPAVAGRSCCARHLEARRREQARRRQDARGEQVRANQRARWAARREIGHPRRVGLTGESPAPAP